MNVLRDLTSAVEFFGTKEIIFETKKIDFFGEYLVTNYFVKLRNLYYQCHSFDPNSLSYEEYRSTGRACKELLLKRLKHFAQRKLKKYSISQIAAQEIINTTLSTGNIIYPYDFVVIDEAVFMKRFIFDDFGSIYKQETIMFHNDYWYDICQDIKFDLVPPGKDVLFDTVDTRGFREKLCEAINTALRPKFGGDVVEIRPDSRRLSIKNEYYVSLYLNQLLYNMAKACQNGQSITVQMIVDTNEDNAYTFYTLNISNYDGGTIIHVEKAKKSVIVLSEAVTAR